MKTMRILTAALPLILCGTPAARPQATNLPAVATTSIAVSPAGVVTSPAGNIHWPTQTSTMYAARITNLVARTVGLEGTSGGFHGRIEAVLDDYNAGSQNTALEIIGKIVEPSAPISNTVARIRMFEDAGGASGLQLLATNNADPEAPVSVNAFSYRISQTGDKTMQLGPYLVPTTDGTSGQLLATDGGGTLNWVDAGGGGGGPYANGVELVGNDSPSWPGTGNFKLVPSTGGTLQLVNEAGTTQTVLMSGNGYLAPLGIDATEGSEGDVITIVSGEATWAAPAGGSSVLAYHPSVTSAVVRAAVETTAFPAIASPGAWSVNLQTHWYGEDGGVEAVHASILGGTSHSIYTAATNSVIVGGFKNTTFAPMSFIGAGADNDITGTSTYSAVAGGLNNNVASTYSFVGAGANNDIAASGSYAVVVGGLDNNITGVSGGFIGGGTSHDVSANYATVGGGWNNDASGEYAFIGGGIDNVASNGRVTLAGGETNTASGLYSSVLGGRGNTASGNGSIAGGNGTAGNGNSASGTISIAFGGSQHSAAANGAAVVGGQDNDTAIGAPFAAVFGGSNNDVTGSPDYAGIFGGQNNVASGTGGVVLGGQQNSAAAKWGQAGGYYGSAYLVGMTAFGGGRPTSPALGDNQTATLRMYRAVTGEAATELTLDGNTAGASNRADMGTSSRLWNGTLYLTGVVKTLGNGTGSIAANQYLTQQYQFVCARVTNDAGTANTFTQVGTTMGNMPTTGLVVALTANTGDGTQRLEVTAPTDAGTTTVIHWGATWVFHDMIW